jgi:hypothetical protein
MAAALLIGGVLVAGVGLLEASPAAAASTTWYAYPSGTSNSTTSCPETSTTASECSLTQALSDAAAGDTVALATSGGTTSTYYVGNFTVSTSDTSAASPLTIAPASGATDPILDGDGDGFTGCPTTTCDGQVLSIDSDVYATIEGISVQDANNIATGTGGGMLLGNNADVTVADSTFFDDSAAFDGGGIYNNGTLTVTNSTFSDDWSPFSGGIYNNGTLTVTNSTFSSDFGTSGGGIGSGAMGGGHLTVTNSTFSGDTSEFGGGIDSGDMGGGSLTVTNSTFSDDTAGHDGGGIDSGDNDAFGILTVTNSTFSGDGADMDGGGIDSGDNRGTDVVELAASILAESSSGSDCHGSSSIFDEGYNIDDDGTCGLSTAKGSLPDESDASIGLGPLRNNGGPTKTIAIPASSVAASLVANDYCPPTDQRGESRPSTYCSAGAYQFSPPAQLVFTTQPGGATAGLAFSTQPVVTIEDTDGNTVTTDTSTVSLAITSGTGTSGAVLSGCTATTTAGVASFSGCKIDTTGTSYTLTATDSSDSLSTTSSAFDVLAGPPAPGSVPSAPTDLTATPGDTKVSLTWDAPSYGGSSFIIGYDVYVGTSSGGESATAVNGTTPVTSTSYTANGLMNGTKYYFIVEALNGVGYSPPSNEASATPASGVPVSRIYGTDAIGTAIAVSEAEFPTSDSAKAVVLARSDFFSDALAGAPLAAKVGGPLLITPGTPLSSALDPRVLSEIERVLPAGGTIYILGGDLAINPDIDTALQGLGYLTQRIAGADEYATAVDIAEQLGNPSVVFEVTGTDFPDALSSVLAAIEKGGAILLTDGPTQVPETAAYLQAHPADTRYAIGGPLAAYGADPTATPVYGQDLYGTSAAVATTFFASATSFGAATSADFEDALSGGVFMGTRDPAGPMLLVPPSGPLPASIASYLSDAASTLTQGYLFGGPLAVGNDVLSELESTG